MLRVLSCVFLVAVVTAEQLFVQKDELGRWTSTATPTPHTAAKGKMVGYMTRTGWDELFIETVASAPDADQAFSAGYVEGLLSYGQTRKMWADVSAYLNRSGMWPLPPVVASFLDANEKYITSQVSANGPSDAYWHQVGLQQRQFEGLLAGLNHQATKYGEPAFQRDALRFFNVRGDLDDLLPALNVTARDEWRRVDPEAFNFWFAGRTHCSAIIKVAADFSDIFFGHATWDRYLMMWRVMKHYTLNYQGATNPSVTFSSYPGALSSIDDFYMTQSGLAVMETSFNIFNPALYAKIGPSSVLSGARAMVANRLATTGEEWAEVFAKQNSGTYNNQWMVLNLNKFTPGQPLVPGTLTILEQMPGVAEVKDATSTLSYGYWPSYNVPSIPAVFDLAGYPKAIERFGPNMLSYQNSVRAKIFERDQSNLFDMPALMAMLQYNHFQTDPLSLGNPGYAIAARFDLMNTSTPVLQRGCQGAIDAKTSTYSMFKNGRQIMAYNGPTPQQGAFDWRKVNPADPFCKPPAHLPLRYDFVWQHFRD